MATIGLGISAVLLFGWYRHIVRTRWAGKKP
jgi:hypothetical protein